MGVPFISATSIKGLSWLGVEVMASCSSASTINQTQPDRNLEAPAALNLALKSSNDPNFALIAAASSTDGWPDCVAGAMVCQKKLWFQCPPALLRTTAGK